MKTLTDNEILQDNQGDYLIVHGNAMSSKTYPTYELAQCDSKADEIAFIQSQDMGEYESRTPVEWL